MTAISWYLWKQVGMIACLCISASFAFLSQEDKYKTINFLNKFINKKVKLLVKSYLKCCPINF